MPENDPNAYLPPELQQSPEPVQQDSVSQQDAALAEAASSSGSGVGDMFLQMAAGFATGFATGYTGRDLLTPFLAQQAERRKERTARVKLLNQVGTLINSYEKGGAIVDELLGITPETSQEDRAKAYAALDQNQLRLIENQINLDRVESDNEEDRIAGLQSQLDSVRAQGAELGMQFTGDPTNRQDVDVYVNLVKHEREKLDQGRAIANNLWATSNSTYNEFGNNVGALSDEDFQKGFLGPMETLYGNEGKLDLWEQGIRESFMVKRRTAVKEYQTKKANEFLDARSLPIVNGEQTGWNDLSDLQRTQMAARLAPEFDALDRIADLPENLRGFLGEPAQKMLDDLGFGDAKNFDEWAANGGDVQKLLSTFPELAREVQKAEIMDQNLSQVETILPDRLGLGIEDVEPAAVLAYKEGGIIQLTDEGREKAIRRLKEEMRPGIPQEQRRALVEQGKQFGIDIADIYEGVSAYESISSNAVAEEAPAFTYEQDLQIERNWTSIAPEPVTFEYAEDGLALSASELSDLSLLQVANQDELSDTQKARLVELDRRNRLTPEQDAADSANRAAMTKILHGENRNVEVIVDAPVNPQTMKAEVDSALLTASLSSAETEGERWKSLFIWTHDTNRRELKTQTERAQSRGGRESWERVVEIAGDLPDLESMKIKLDTEWRRSMEPEYDKYVARMETARHRTEWTQIESFDKWLEDPPVDPPGNLEVINRYFGYRLNSSEIKFQVGEKDKVIDIEDFDMDELALFIASVGLNV